MTKIVSSGSISRHCGVIQPRGGAFAVPPVGFRPAGADSRRTAKSRSATGLLATSQSRRNAERLAFAQSRSVWRHLEVEPHDEGRRRLRRERVDDVPVGHHEVRTDEETRAERPPRRRLDAAHRQLGLTESLTPLRDVGEPGAEDALLEVGLVWHRGRELYALGELPQRASSGRVSRASTPPARTPSAAGCRVPRRARR